MKLRPIQTQAIEKTLDSFRAGGTYHLLYAPVGWGKTIFSAFLMNHAFQKYGARSLFLAHLTELIVQTRDKCSVAIPDAKIGVICGSLNQKVSSDITIGTRQTVEKNLDLVGKIGLLIIDEIHLYSPQYQKIVDHFLELNPRLRVLGVTGTPYKIKDGYIYGPDKIWNDPFFSTTIDEMIELGYLSPYRYKVAEDMSKKLDSVKIVAGEYHEGELGELMSEDHHLGSVQRIIDDHCQGRQSILIFAVSIAHAESLASFLGCDCVHSNLGAKEWRKRVDDFKDGKRRCLVNVSQLSIGFDHPGVDAIITARPTNSTALHVQICGRGLRIEEGKKDCLIVDMVGNFKRHGLPSFPKVKVQKDDDYERKEKERGASVCPECFEAVEALTICPVCGTELTAKKEVIELHEEMRLKEIEVQRKRPRFERWWKKDNHVTRQGSVGILFFCLVTNRSKPLMRFCGEGTKKSLRVYCQLDELKKGQVVEIVRTGFGEWIA